MRKSRWLGKINERVDAQWCLLKQRVRSCDAVSNLRIPQSFVNEFLTVVVHLRAVLAAESIDSRCRDEACLLYTSPSPRDS